jgi:ABC-type nickel/cobalt efflux system permease component RcnA
MNWKSAWAAIAAVGIRPCSGALIVLTFAFLNQLWMGGILSVLAMSLGTAITVSVLATLAVMAKAVAMRVAGGGKAGRHVHDGIEIAGALFVFLIGVLLLTAAMNG